MNLLILHLSDMHFGKKNNYKQDNVDAIVSALQESITEVNNVLVIVTGDLSYSGKKGECLQVRFFLSALKNAIKYRYHQVCDIQFVMVPGNHDMDYAIGELKRSDLEDMEKNGSYKKGIDNELNKQTQFFVLANHYKSFSSEKILDQKTIAYGERIVQFNLINTAIFSSRDEDQGFHYLDDSAIERLSIQNNSDFVITVMHHPHHWYSSICKKNLEEALYSRSDLIFVGHEHYESSMKIEHDDSSVHVFSAGKLGDRGDWTDSEFHVAVLNLDTRAYITRKYHWNETQRIYEEIGKENLLLSRDRYNQLGLIVRQEFFKSLEEDKYLISNSVRDYFVFPLLIEELVIDDNSRIPKEIDSLEELIETLDSQNKIIISGNSDSGKSVLARAIYAELTSRKITLFVKGGDIGPNPERTIREAFKEAYTDDNGRYEAFKQTLPEDLAIVIDDIDAIDSSRLEIFVDYIESHFGVIVETCQTEIDVDITRRLKKRANTIDFAFYRIAPFYSQKRKELVTNVVRIASKSDQDSQEHIIELLCEVLTRQKYLYGWNPEFIVQFVRYYCKNIGEATQNDGSVFSKVFEANLTQLIMPFARNISVEKVMMILDKIAYGIYDKHTYPIPLANVDILIQEYNSAYGSKVDTHEFISLLLNSRILKKTDKGYVFYDRNYLSYFTAREIRRRYLEDNDDTQLSHVMEYSYTGLNADILLFVTYITDNLNIIRMVMEKALESVEGWEEFDLKNIDISFLDKSVEQVVKPYEEGDKEKIEEERNQQEKEEIQSMAIANDETVFSGEKGELSFIQKIIRSISLMIILARTLPSFEHMMKKKDKEDCVDMLYRMPLKIFKTWAKHVDAESSELIANIKQFQEDEYRKEKLELTPMEDKDALCILKWEATSLLLDLMNVAITSATRENTNDYLDGFNYKELPTYGIEHLMGLAKRDNVSEFGSEAERILVDEKKNYMAKVMVQRIARNYMVNSKRIKQSDTQRLNAKLFGERLQHDRILIEQQRNKEKQ